MYLIKILIVLIEYRALIKRFEDRPLHHNTNKNINRTLIVLIDMREDYVMQHKWSVSMNRYM